MSDHDHDAHGHDEPRDYETGRTTAPQSPYTMGDVRNGLIIAIVGLVLVFGVPIALTL